MTTGSRISGQRFCYLFCSQWLLLNWKGKACRHYKPWKLWIRKWETADPQMASQKTLVLLCSQVSKARNLKNLRHSALFFQILKELRLERTEPEKMRQLVSPQPLAPSPYQNTNVTPIIKGSAGTCSPQMGFCFLFCWGGGGWELSTHSLFPHTSAWSFLCKVDPGKHWEP